MGFCSWGSRCILDAWHEGASKARTPPDAVLLEMDVSDQNADIYYGRILRILDVDLSIIYDGEGIVAEWMTNHKLVWMDWATGLMRGRHGQIFKNGSRPTAFSGGTIEDDSIVKRPICFVEHCIPSGPNNASDGRSSRSGGRRSRRRIYFMDHNIRTDRLLQSTVIYPDGMNRMLRGMAPSN